MIAGAWVAFAGGVVLGVFGTLGALVLVGAWLTSRANRALKATQE